MAELKGGNGVVPFPPFFVVSRLYRRDESWREEEISFPTGLFLQGIFLLSSAHHPIENLKSAIENRLAA